MFQDLPTSAGLDCHGLCTVASSNSHLVFFLDPLLVMSTHTLKELPLLPTTQPKPTVSLSLLEVYFEERCHPCQCYRQDFAIQNTLPEFRCVGLRKPHSCKRRTTYFFCFTHHVYSQGGPNFVLVMSFVAPFCGRSFFKLSRSRPFSCNVLSWLAPTATFVHTAGGSVYGSSTPLPHTSVQLRPAFEGHWKGSTSPAPTPTDGKSGKSEESVGIDDARSRVSSEVTKTQSTALDADSVAASASAPTWQNSQNDWRQSWWTPDRSSSDAWFSEPTTRAISKRDTPGPRRMTFASRRHHW